MNAQTPTGVTSGERFRSWPEIAANAARGAGMLAGGPDQRALCKFIGDLMMVGAMKAGTAKTRGRIK